MRIMLLEKHPLVQNEGITDLNGLDHWIEGQISFFNIKLLNLWAKDEGVRGM